MLCMICNTNNNTVKCTQPNKHGFAYVIHYENDTILHKHYRFINPDELPIGNDEIIDLNVIPTNITQNVPNPSLETLETLSDNTILYSDNSSDIFGDVVTQNSDRPLQVPVAQAPRPRKRNAIPTNVVPTEDNVL